MAALTKELDKISAESTLASEKVGPSLLSHVQSCFRDAETAKNSNGIIEGLSINAMHLESLDRRNSVHTTKMKSKLTAQGLPDFFEPLTDQKCRDAISWWHDATVSYGSDWFHCEATEEAELPDDAKELIRQEVVEWEMKSRLSGADPWTTEQLQALIDERYEKSTQATKDKAKTRSGRMTSRIKDQFQDFDYRKLRDAFRLDLVTFGTAFLWGPFVKTVKVPKWENGKRAVKDIQKPWAEVVDPRDIFPAPWMTETTDHGYICRRMKIHPGELAGFKGVEGWQDAAIDALISESTVQNQTVVTGDDQRARQEGKDPTQDKRADFIWFVGYVRGSLLKSYGADFADESKEYHVHVCWMGNHLLRVKANWYDLEKPPIVKAVCYECPGSFWGFGIPMKMKAAQDKANAIVIPMLDNIGWAAGGVTEIDQYRMVNPADAANWHVRKVVLLKEPDTQTTLPAIRHTSFPLRSDEFGALLAQVSNEADEQSGVRKYSLGSDKVAGAGRTSSGLAMLTDAANKTLKEIMYRADKAESEFVGFFADWNNEFGPDDIKGDIKIVTSGASGFYVQELRIQQINAMIDRLLNPALLQIPGVMEQIMSLLGELGQSMRVSIKYLMNDKDITAKIEELRLQAVAAANAKAAQGGANSAGTPPNPEEQVIQAPPAVTEGQAVA